MARKNPHPEPEPELRIRGLVESGVQLASGLPADHDALLAVVLDALRSCDAGVIAGDWDEVRKAGLLWNAAVWKLNGETFDGCRDDRNPKAAGLLVDRLCRAIPGTPPLWGQLGEFVIEVNGVRCLVECGHGFGGLHSLHFNFYAVDLDRPFISDTGYRSHFADAVAGSTVLAAAESAFSGYLVGKKRIVLSAEARDRMADRPLPFWCSNLNPAPARRPATCAIPDGYALVDVVLPLHQAFIVKRWAEAAERKRATIRQH